MKGTSGGGAGAGGGSCGLGIESGMGCSGMGMPPAGSEPLRSVDLGRSRRGVWISWLTKATHGARAAGWVDGRLELGSTAACVDGTSGRGAMVAGLHRLGLVLARPRRRIVVASHRDRGGRPLRRRGDIGADGRLRGVRSEWIGPRSRRGRGSLDRPAPPCGRRRVDGLDASAPGSGEMRGTRGLGRRFARADDHDHRRGGRSKNVRETGHGDLSGTIDGA